MKWFGARIGPSTLAFTVFVVLYHGYSFFSGEYVKLVGLASTSRLEVKIGQRTLISFITPTIAGLRFSERPDGAARAITAKGYIFRYLVGQLPEIFFPGTDRETPWYFIRPEVAYSFDEVVRPALIEGNLLTREIIDRLEALGVTVVVVPVPTKLSMARSKISGELPQSVSLIKPKADRGPEDARRAYERIVGGDPRIVNLFEVFERESRGHAELSHLRLDTHWNSQGIVWAAGAVLENLRGRGWKLPTPVVQRPVVDRAPAYCVDTLQLPEGYLQRKPQLIGTDQYYSFEPARGPAPWKRIVVFGSSYSVALQGTPFNFATVMSRALGIPLMNMAESGKGSIGSFRRAAKEGFRFLKGDLLVWEYPLRDLPARTMEFPQLPVAETSKKSEVFKW